MPLYDEAMSDFRNYNKELREKSDTYKLLKRGRHIDVKVIDDKTLQVNKNNQDRKRRERTASVIRLSIYASWLVIQSVVFF